jgi:hypothetical protein
MNPGTAHTALEAKIRWDFWGGHADGFIPDACPIPGPPRTFAAVLCGPWNSCPAVARNTCLAVARTRALPLSVSS